MSEEKIYKLVEIPTQMGLAIQTPDEKTISDAELLVLIANKLDKIEKAL